MKEEEQEKVENILSNIVGEKNKVIKLPIADGYYVPKKYLDRLKIHTDDDNYYFISNLFWEDTKDKIDNALTEEEIIMKSAQDKILNSDNIELKGLMSMIRELNNQISELKGELNKNETKQSRI